MMNNKHSEVKQDILLPKSLLRIICSSVVGVDSVRRWLDYVQCDQIGQFIRHWATFQRLWQQLVWPNLPHSKAIFVKVSISLIFLVKSFWATFIDIWRLFTGHTEYVFNNWLFRATRIGPRWHRLKFCQSRLKILPSTKQVNPNKWSTNYQSFAKVAILCRIWSHWWWLAVQIVVTRDQQVEELA